MIEAMVQREKKETDEVLKERIDTVYLYDHECPSQDTHANNIRQLRRGEKGVELRTA